MPVKEKEKKGRGQAERAREFLREIRSELRKVVWPTRQEAVNLTMIVIGVSAAVGVFLGLVDFTFSEMFRIILR
ncbi:MAG: preprotein translocase subunit SecE [Sphingomonadaceae bacterium]